LPYPFLLFLSSLHLKVVCSKNFLYGLAIDIHLLV
jgi:hypothetical protein